MNNVGNEYCDLCRCISLNECMKHTNECSVDSEIKSEYAAIDATITSGNLPFIEPHKLRSPIPSGQVSCVDSNIYVESTLVAVLGTYSNFHNIIHMGHPNTLDSASLLNLSLSFQARTKQGVGICVTPVPGCNSAEYKLSMHGSYASHTVNKSGLVKFLAVVLEGGNNICWYWDYGFRWCIPVLHGSDNNIWVDMKHKDQPANLEYVGLGGSRTMQCFHSHFKDNATLTINTGSGLMSTQTRKDETLLLASVVSDCVNGVSKDRKCYFCSYVNEIHKQKHTIAKKDAVLGTLRLTRTLMEALDS